MRLAFFGSDAFALPSLQALAGAGHTITLALTNPDRPRGRSKQLLATPIKEEALRLGVPVLQPPGRPNRADAARIRESGAELGVVVAYGQFLAGRVRKAPGLGYSINLHGSLLPRWRGAAPVAAAILAGDARSGVSVQQVAAEMDAGPLLLSREEPIRPEDTRGSLRERLATLGAELLVDAVARIAGGEAEFQAQDEAGVTLAPLLQKTDGRLELSRPADELERRVRACSPWPGAFFETPKGRVQVLEARVLAPAEAEGAPGTVLAGAGDELWVATGGGGLALSELKPAGKRAMSGRAYANGRRLGPGDSL